jgi:hypothetical protein
VRGVSALVFPSCECAYSDLPVFRARGEVLAVRTETYTADVQVARL